MASESEKIFVNSAWIKNVPAKSPQGTPLQAGVNAFASIDEALNKYPDDLGEKEVILLDRAPTVNNTKGDVNINFTYLASQELDKDAVKNVNTATSTVIAGGDLTLNYNAGEGADPAVVGGFFNVNISTPLTQQQTGANVVFGGKNVATHTYVATDAWQKGSAAITSVAAGTLNVSNSNVSFAGGTFTPVEGTEGFDITEDEPFFAVSGLGDVTAFEFEDGDSRLAQLSGYANVSLKNGATASELRGGVQNYSVSSVAGYNADSEPISVTKTYVLSTTAAGALTADKSEVGSAVGYATATITESNFEALDAFSTSVSEKSAYAMGKAVRFNNELVTTKASIVTNRSQLSAGKATISKVEAGGTIDGYNSVTIADSTVGAVTAGNIAGTTTETQTSVQSVANQNASVVTTDSNVGSNAATYAASGVLQAKASTLASAYGFTNVSLDATNVEGDILSVTSAYDLEDKWQGFSGTVKGSFNSVAVDQETVQEKSTANSSAYAVGTLTAQNTSTISGAIKGYLNVTLNKTTAGDIDAGKISRTVTGSDIVKGELLYHQDAVATDTVASGTLNLKDSSVGQASGFSVVSAENVEFAGGIIDGGKTSLTVKEDSTVKVDAQETLSGVYKIVDSAAAVGKMNLKNCTVGGAINGYASIVGTTAIVEGGIGEGWTTVNTGVDDHKFNDVTGAVTTRESSNTTRTAAASLKLSKDSIVNGDVEGYATVVAEDTTFGAGFAGGKQIESTVVNYSKTIKNDVVTEITTAANDTLVSAGGKLYLDDAVLSGDGEITGYQAVTFKDVEGSVALLDSENSKTSDNTKNTIVDDVLTGRTRKATVAKTASSSLTLTDGDDEDFTVAKVVGFNKINATYGTLSEIDRITVPEEEDAFATDKEEYSLTYAKNTARTSLKAAQKNYFTANGSVSLSGKAQAGAINGYSSITIKGTQQVPVTAGSIEGVSWSDSISLATEKDANDEYISSSYTFAGNDTASLSINASFAETDAVNGFKAAVFSGNKVLHSTVAALTGGTAQVRKETITVSRKGDLYTEAASKTKTTKAFGTVKMDYTYAEGGIYGASKVIATNSTIGGLLDSYNEDSSRKTQTIGTVLVTEASGLTDDVLEEEAFEYATVDRDTATKFTQTKVETSTAKASATLTNTIVNGSVDGYGTVTLVNSDILGSASAWAYREDTKTTYDKNVLNETITMTDNVIGAFSAQNSYVEGTLTGFAAVALNNVEVGGEIQGGKFVWTETWKGNGATYGEAVEDAELTEKEVVYAAGTLKATDALIVGAIRNYKSITFAGDNEIRGGIYGVSSDKDAVAIAAKSALTLTGNAVIGHVDEDNEEFNAIDSLSIGGTLRIAVGSVDELELKVNKIAGAGMIAIQDDDYEAIKEVVVAKVGPKFDIVNGGDEYAIKTIRTRAEELSDNAQAKATAVKANTEVNGWLSGTAENEMFKDAEDWFTFSKEKGGWAVNDYEVEFMGGTTDIQAELWSGATKINESVWKEDTGSGFAINTENLGSYSSVQLKLFVENDVTPVAYAVSVHSVA